MAANWDINTVPGSTVTLYDVFNDFASAAITFNSGDFTINSFLSQGAFNLTGGRLSGSSPASTFQVNNTLTFNGGTLRNFIVNTGIGSFIVFANSASNTLDALTVNGNLDLTVGTGTAQVVNGLILNGTATLNNSGRLVFAGGTQTLGGTGTVVFGDTGGNRFALDSGAALTIGSGVTLRGHSATTGQALLNAPTGTLTNNGLISADVNGGTLTLNPVSLANDTTGRIEARNGGTVNINAGGTPTNAGTLSAAAASVLSVSGNLTQTAGLTDADGTVVLNNGSGTLFLQGGALTGDGTVQGRVNNTGGAINPGGATRVESLSLTGTFSQGDGGTLFAELSGAGAGQQDLFAVGGAATLDGVVTVDLLDGFAPQIGEEFTVLTYLSRTGLFDAITALDTGYVFEGIYNSDNFRVRVTATPGPGALVVLGAGLLPLAARLRRRKP